MKEKIRELMKKKGFIIAFAVAVLVIFALIIIPVSVSGKKEKNIWEYYFDNKGSEYAKELYREENQVVQVDDYTITLEETLYDAGVGIGYCKFSIKKDSGKVSYDEECFGEEDRFGFGLNTTGSEVQVTYEAVGDTLFAFINFTEEKDHSSAVYLLDYSKDDAESHKFEILSRERTKKFVLNENAQLVISPLGITIDSNRRITEIYIELKYKDGSTQVIVDEKNREEAVKTGSSTDANNVTNYRYQVIADEIINIVEVESKEFNGRFEPLKITEDDTEAGEEEGTGDSSQENEQENNQNETGGEETETQPEKVYMNLGQIIPREELHTWITEYLFQDIPSWFETYNGTESQIVPYGDLSAGPLCREDIVYYKPQEDKLAATIMVDHLLSPLTEESDKREYVILSYKLKSITTHQVADNIWIIEYIDGYYKYEGTDDGRTMEDRSYEDMTSDGMLQFWVPNERDYTSLMYVVMRHEGVYRMQSLSAMMNICLSRDNENPLTNKELAWFNNDFFGEKNDGEPFNIINMFLVSEYETPEDIDIAKVFAAGTGKNENISQEEYDLLSSKYDNFSPEYDTTKMSEKEMNKIISQYLGLELDEVKTDWAGLYYLEEYKAYYTQSGGYELAKFYIESGYKNEDGTITLRYGMKEYGIWMEVTLKKVGNSYQFISNKRLL